MNRITFPPVVQAGKEETIYTTIAVKPLPANLPSLNVTLMHSDGSSTVDAISNWTIPSPSNSFEYIILHTFTIPLEVDSMTSVFLRIDLPNDQVWRNIEDSQLAIGGIGIIFPGEMHTYLEVIVISIWIYKKLLKIFLFVQYPELNILGIIDNFSTPSMHKK